MTIHTIRLLKREWRFDDAKRLGKPGGFGEVFRGSGPLGEVAVKRLHLTAAQASHREMTIGEHLAREGLVNVIRTLDSGQDAESDRYFLIMPICERSLDEEINASKGGLNLEHAISIVRDILNGLLEVAEITHRDLKPANILFHEGVWKIADFGIAKFVEDSTSLETLRGSLTPAYGAPEQWRGERPSGATDVYAVGCIMHAMLTSAPPFTGSMDELREKHLHSLPNKLDQLPALEAGFVTHMLRKSPTARPTVKRCLEVFSRTSTAGFDAKLARSILAEAGSKVAEAEARADAAAQEQKTRVERRSQLGAEARSILQEIRQALFNDILDNAESASLLTDSVLTLGSANLEFRILRPVLNPTEHEHWDIICLSEIFLTVEYSGQQGQYVWSSTLAYARKGPHDEYRWYEMAFWSLGGREADSPFAIVDAEKVRSVLSPTMRTVQVAYGPLPIDAEDEHSFFDRWEKLVAKAALGNLRAPINFPINLELLLP